MSRNSDGPLIRRRLRFSRSSIGRVPSLSVSTICPASFDALAAAFPDTLAIVGRAFAKPNSTSRRMASEREGVSFNLAAQASTRTLRSSGRRIAVTGSRPVAGRPRFFFRIARTRFGIFRIATNRDCKNCVRARPAGYRPARFVVISPSDFRPTPCRGSTRFHSRLAGPH